MRSAAMALHSSLQASRCYGCREHECHALCIALGCLYDCTGSYRKAIADVRSRYLMQGVDVKTLIPRTTDRMSPGDEHQLERQARQIDRGLALTEWYLLVTCVLCVESKITRLARLQKETSPTTSREVATSSCRRKRTSS